MNLEPGAGQPKFDLEERTARFGESIIDFAKKIPVNLIAGTSVGATYCEADDAGSKKEFLYRISLCKRESRESKHWLRMTARAVPELVPDARILFQEAKELNLIFSAIFRRKRRGD